MGYAIFAFFGVFLMIVSGGLLLFYREEMLQRISDAINPQPKEKSLLTAIQKTGLSIGGVIEHFEPGRGIHRPAAPPARRFSR
jgi:hypothetical protein